MALAIQRKDVEQLRAILERVERYGSGILQDGITLTTVLHIAAKLGTEEMWRLVMSMEEVREMVNYSDLKGVTPLMAACWYKNRFAVQTLLDAGADPTKAAKGTRKTALHHAAKQETAEICEMLLAVDSSPEFVNAYNEEGTTAFLIAIDACSPSYGLLLRSGADHRLTKLNSGRTALHTAVTAENHEVLRDLLDRFQDGEYVNKQDINGDTALMIAIRINDVEAVRAIMEAPLPGHLSKVGEVSGDSGVHLAIKNGSREVLRLCLKSDTERELVDGRDAKGRTPLMYAVSRKDVDCVREILWFNPDVTVVDEVTKRSIVHLAAVTGRREVMEEVLSIEGIEEVVPLHDKNNLTAFELALAQSDPRVVFAFFEAGFVQDDYLNHKDETALFIAARAGNLRLVQALLLSGLYVTNCANFLEDVGLETLRADEIVGGIYPSDLYILKGYETSGRGWDASPRGQEILFRHNRLGQNVYHACALGENLETLKFVHLYCSRYNLAVRDFDEPDLNGNTPLMLAAQCGSPQLTSFFLKRGANIGLANAVGITALESMVAHLPDYRRLLMQTMNECVVIDSTVRGLRSHAKDMVVDLSFFCPRGFNQMTIVALLFMKLRSEKDIKVLESPVLELFTVLKWRHLSRMMYFRFLLNCLLTGALSLYQTASLCAVARCGASETLVDLLWWAVLIVCLPSLLFALPSLNTAVKFGWLRWLHGLTVFLSPALSLLYLFLDPARRSSLEVGAGAVLSSWLSILIYGSVTRLDHQVSMLHRVFRAFLNHSFVYLVFVLGFSFSFFILFHNHFNFNNPLHSALYTSTVMIEGTLDSNPIFSQKQRISDQSSEGEAQEDVVGGGAGDCGPTTPGDADDPAKAWQTLDKGKMREMKYSIFDGFIIFLFRGLVCVCVMNMMVVLAVRGGSELEQEGKVDQTRNMVANLYEWEAFTESGTYRVLRAIGLAGVVTVLKWMTPKVDLPTMYYPLESGEDCPVRLHSLKDHALDWSQVKPLRFTPLLARSSDSSSESSSEEEDDGMF